MGCTAESLKIEVSKYAQECKDLFNKYFDGCFYYDQSSEDDCGQLEVETEEDGSGILSFDCEPFFTQSVMYDSVFYFFKLFCAKYKDVEASLEYYAEYSVDASSQTLSYTYSNGVVKGRTVYGIGDSFMGECEECGWEPWEDCDEDGFPQHLFDIDDFDPNKTYTCPKCGAEIDTSDWSVEEHEVKIEEFIEERKGKEPLLD